LVVATKPVRVQGVRLMRLDTHSINGRAYEAGRDAFILAEQIEAEAAPEAI
jgi:hypothetical protein